MTYTTNTTEAFLATIAPFNQLSSIALARLAKTTQLLRYRMGQPIVLREKLPAQIAILYEGQARLLGYEPGKQLPVTLQRLEAGAVIGWVGLVRGAACETAIASTEAICLTLAAVEFLTLMAQEEAFADHFHDQPALIEVFDLVGAELQHRADSELILKAAGVSDLKEFAFTLQSQAIVHNLRRHLERSRYTLPPDHTWIVSGGETSAAVPIGSQFDPNKLDKARPPAGTIRLLGIPAIALSPSVLLVRERPLETMPITEILYAPDQPLEDDRTTTRTKRQYPYVRARGELETTLACFQMLANHLGLPFRRDVVRKILANQKQRTGSFSLSLGGAIAEMMGLNAQLVSVPLKAISRLQTPALIRYYDSFAVLYEASENAIVLGVPESGIVRRKPNDLITEVVTVDHGDHAASLQTSTAIDVLLLQSTPDTPQQKFGLTWFLPFLSNYRQVLIEVLLASLFVQLFGLANPLMTQVIIDKVVMQNSPDTLPILGIFLIVIAIFEAILSSLRTYLLVDTTNRIDLALSAEIINHLLRLPLRYFERRPVGELSTRMHELENIRQFLTTTALTSVMDAIFSIIYIGVMFLYSWQLTLVALATLPIFALLTTLISPLVRRQLRAQADRNAEAQSYLVEVLAGIQTVKAQNLELRSRWQWQDRYARYVSAGFKTVLTSTAASSTSNFLNQLSSLMVLWVGASLLLQGKLTLGQLIAFRIIAGYVTSPLLRLTQLWQNFQQTALALERLGDIVDTPVEGDATDVSSDRHQRHNIPLPTIQGTVTYENVSFRFHPSGSLQLNNVSVTFPAGAFVGIAGLSGSGKSTMMKLLPRLYPLESGRILIDGYDISKVDLYSLRQQIGVVPQDTLLFEGTVQENIALNHPDATSEEIIAAAKVAVAHDFIMNLPNGYNTRVGERGAALSGGQRQRIAIARTVLQNPHLLILDEATSALDYDAERHVCLNLIEAFNDRTVFFITHRLSTIRHADVIVMMDQGSVVEQGTHEELMALEGRYYCLYRQQEALSS
ncbi:ABC transporter transmembrane domain-containing protein [Stenomitos frigidus]|uniref:Type I secretion system permease/ATPase n=1 Tax=Stenomitos frigidus ULC18 TaxID=2107698 RepID=A0A2T1EHL4_9CYAN|nr:ABC transporter transmembrane domain-containing protein [Stenomitos frigidus]PSB32204.1 type I secretion system permease/ATPase [Stenomitos frigidus ULC18]